MIFTHTNRETSIFSAFPYPKSVGSKQQRRKNSHSSFPSPARYIIYSPPPQDYPLSDDSIY